MPIPTPQKKRQLKKKKNVGGTLSEFHKNKVDLNVKKLKEWSVLKDTRDFAKF
jgi:hypothetical protein